VSGKLLPGGRRKEYCPRLPAFSKDSHLPGVISLLEMLPPQCAQFEDPQAGSIKKPQEGSIAAARLKSQNLVDSAFSENAL